MVRRIGLPVRQPDDVVKPLHGVRLLDFTRLMPGNYCAWLLAMLGADVIKVEDPGPGDYMRSIGVSVDGMGAANHLVNRAKRSVVIDLKKADGVQTAMRLVGESDALVESFRPGVMARLGLGADHIRALHPNFVYASLSGYGATGPLVDLAAHDLNYLGSAGMLDRFGEDGGGPIVPPIPLADLIGGGLVPTIGILAQLFAVRAGRRGAWLDASFTDAVALLPHPIIGDLLAGAQASSRGGGDYGGGLGSYAIYQVMNGHVAVGALERHFWEEVCEVLGLPELAPWQHDAERQHEIREALQRRFSSMTKEDVQRAFAGRDTCVTVISSYEEMLKSDLAAGRGLLVHDEALPMPMLAAPFMFDGVRPDSSVPAPRQGEHTREVLVELGFADSEVTRLIGNGAVGLPE